MSRELLTKAHDSTADFKARGRSPMKRKSASCAMSCARGHGPTSSATSLDAPTNHSRSACICVTYGKGRPPGLDCIKAHRVHGR